MGRGSGSPCWRLQLEDLSAHDEVKVTLELFILKTWDGNSACCGPDRWRAWVDGGPVLLDATFSNDDAPFEPEFFQSYPEPYPGGSNPGLTGAAEKGTLGYPDESGYGGVGGSIYRFTFTFRHSGSSLTLRFTDPPRGDANELWGLDCVRVKVRTTEVRQGGICSSPATATAACCATTGGRPPSWVSSCRPGAAG